MIATSLLYCPLPLLLTIQLDFTWQDIETDVLVDHHGHGARDGVQVVDVVGVSVNGVCERLRLKYHVDEVNVVTLVNLKL